MDDLIDVIIASHSLNRRELLPINNIGYYVIRGYSDWTPIWLEVHFFPGRMLIKRLSIRPSLQRGGIGRTIVEYLQQECRKQNLSLIETVRIHSGSVGFWEKCGFTIFGHRGQWKAH